jgi:hypothetical protein
LTGKLDWQLQIAAHALGVDFRVVGGVRLTELRLGRPRRVPGSPGLRINPKRKLDECGQVVGLSVVPLEAITLADVAEFFELRRGHVSVAHGLGRNPYPVYVRRRCDVGISIDMNGATAKDRNHKRERQAQKI